MVNRKNVVLITIECLRSEECRVPSNVPNLHRIRRRSLEYPNFYSSSSWTPPAIHSVFTSKYPLAEEGRVSIAKHDLTLAQILQENGYYTAGLTPGHWLSRYFGFDKGFEDFCEGAAAGLDKETVYSRVKKLVDRLSKDRGTARAALEYLYRLKKYYRPATRFGRQLNSRALSWLNDHLGNRPFFLWIHYPETHEPYYPPRQMTDHAFSEIWRVNKRAMAAIRTRERGELKLTPQEEKVLLDLYRSRLREVDNTLGDLLEQLGEAGYLNEDTYVFIMGDHGQQFFEHGDFGHGLYLYQELCNVPLLIYNRDFQGKKDERPASGLDIAPTILDLAGVACPRQFCGQSLLDSVSTDRCIILEEGRDKRKDFIIKGNSVYLDNDKYKVALVKSPYKFIMNSNALYELYDLERDPREQNNLASTEVAVCSTLRSRLEGHLQEMRDRDFGERTRNRIQNLKARGRI